jgi:hypothetical protein
MNLKSHESATPVRDRSFNRRRRQQPSDPPVASDSRKSDEEYRVGPGRPPREYQFKPGQSGNPKGSERKTSLAPDLKAMLERAPGRTRTHRQQGRGRHRQARQPIHKRRSPCPARSYRLGGKTGHRSHGRPSANNRESASPASDSGRSSSGGRLRETPLERAKQ